MEYRFRPIGNNDVTEIVKLQMLSKIYNGLLNENDVYIIWNQFLCSKIEIVKSAVRYR